MRAKPVRFTINLVPKDPFFQTGLGRTLKWALSVGRYIVIFTELIVIFSFATRFSLDRQVTDLNDAIKNREAVIDSYGDLEDKVRLAQQKVDNVQQINQQANVIDIFPKLSQLTPLDVQLNSLVIKNTNVILEGTTKSQPALNTLINNLQLSSDVLNLIVDKIETSQTETGAFSFRLRFDTKPPVPARAPAPAPTSRQPAT
jgi:Tfp pilus assembly protein PilN